LQIGVPGGLELGVLLIILVIPLSIGYWVSQDAQKRGSDHHLAWGAMAFFSVFGYGIFVIVFLIFYFVVRDDIGEIR
ncbi:MAG: hypothetical protein R3324_22060, partial [Halobacteriales archaeon]|nr:hypothetical protein [Halobacteriales archaeon]